MKLWRKQRRAECWRRVAYGFGLVVGLSVGQVGLGAAEGRAGHWAYQPVATVPLPALGEGTESAGVRNEIDYFVVQRLRAAGLRMSEEADRRTLIRRLSFDLLGLPPSPEEVAEFEADDGPMAYERVVDRYLASPRFGERWARHWLDVAHYADTHGFERDQRRDRAWPYRDYVISSFNEDKPYDEFVREQVAGDVIWPGRTEAVVATGFLAAGPWDFVGQVETQNPVLRRAARADDLNDMVSQVMGTFTATTVHCARCHDHKLDPIKQEEYYGLWAVFAGVKRGERDRDPLERARLDAERRVVESELREARDELRRMLGSGLDLADVVGGGDGTGNGRRGAGLDPRSGRVQIDRLGFLEGVSANRAASVSNELVTAVFVPDGAAGEVRLGDSGVSLAGFPATSRAAWDAIRNGPVNAQKSTRVGAADYGEEGSSLLGLHANAAITFDLRKFRDALGGRMLQFSAGLGYGGRPESGKVRADARVWLDDRLVFVREGIGPESEPLWIDLLLGETATYLTLMATDGGDGIGHDQVFFGDPKIRLAGEELFLGDVEMVRVIELERRVQRLEERIRSWPVVERVYGVVSEAPPVVHVLERGDPERPGRAVAPGTLRCVEQLSAELGTETMGEGERRRALAEWLASPTNPLTRRVMMNRLWHYHFGVGLVDTPSDFGAGGGRPSHPELLDWLAERLLREGWSLKAMHRLMVCSAVYRQSSVPRPEGVAVDGENRLLWRMPAQRLEAESIRDAMLRVAGTLDESMGGPGYHDFEYREEYAPVYRYRVTGEEESFRRSIYRFVVRSTPHPFMTVLDCPNPSGSAPVRTTTTTALQSLALLNNEFVLAQAEGFARRVRGEAGGAVERQVERSFRLALQRGPTPSEMVGATGLVKEHGLEALGRALFNASEFVYAE